jgi:acetolactate synthase-1/2/3 large subunit
MFAAQHYLYDRPNSWFTSGGLGTMGYSLPAAIGVQVARPTEPVWCLVGDGCFQMTSQELAVLVQERLPVKIALFNNQYLGMVRQWQELFYNKNYQGVQLDNGDPDFVKLAEAYRVPSVRVTRPDQIERAVQQAIDFPGPFLIEFQVAREECVCPMVVPGTALIECIPDTPYVRAEPAPVAVQAPPSREPVHASGGAGE